VGQGAGTTIINAQSIDRVFQITAAATVTFQDLTITGGLVSDDGTAGAQPGSAASVGGGILVTAPRHRSPSTPPISATTRLWVRKVRMRPTSAERAETE